MRTRIQILPLSIPLLVLFLFYALFALRSLDDNALTNWAWVFDHVDLKGFSPFLILGLLLAYPAAKLSAPKGFAGAALFCLSALVALPFWREPELILDAARYFSYAKHIELHGMGSFLQEWGDGMAPWTDLPLIPLLYGLIFKILGESRTAIQIFTTFLFSSTVLLTYRIGRLLWSEGLGIHAGVLLLGFPYLITQVPLMLVDVPTMFFLTLALYTTIRALRRGGALCLTLSSLTVFLCLFTKYSAWMMLSVLALPCLLYLRKAPATTLRRSAFVVLVAGLAAGAVFLVKYQAFIEQFRLLTQYQLSGLQRWGESFLSTFIFQIHPLVTASAVWSITSAIRNRDWDYLIISWLPFLVVVLQIERIRYMIPVFPMFALMASYGLHGLKNPAVKSQIVSCIAIASLVTGLFAYLPFLGRISAANLRDAGRFLNALEIAGVEVLTPVSRVTPYNPAISVPILDLFTRRQIVYRTGSHVRPPREDFETSSLRFTWTYRVPSYYDDHPSPGDKATVIIAEDAAERPPETLSEESRLFRSREVFAKSTGIFDYQTIVTVFY